MSTVAEYGGTVMHKLLYAGQRQLQTAIQKGYCMFGAPAPNVCDEDFTVQDRQFLPWTIPKCC